MCTRILTICFNQNKFIQIVHCIRFSCTVVKNCAHHTKSENETISVYIFDFIAKAHMRTHFACAYDAVCEHLPTSNRNIKYKQIYQANPFSHIYTKCSKIPTSTVLQSSQPPLLAHARTLYIHLFYFCVA